MKNLGIDKPNKINYCKYHDNKETITRYNIYKNNVTIQKNNEFTNKPINILFHTLTKEESIKATKESPLKLIPANINEWVNLLKEEVDPHINGISNRISSLSEDEDWLEYQESTLISVKSLFLLLKSLIKINIKLKPELSIHDDGIIQAQWIFPNNNFLVIACEDGEYCFAILNQIHKGSKKYILESKVDIESLLFFINQLGLKHLMTKND